MEEKKTKKKPAAKTVENTKKKSAKGTTPASQKAGNKKSVEKTPLKTKAAPKAKPGPAKSSNLPGKVKPGTKKSTVPKTIESTVKTKAASKKKPAPAKSSNLPAKIKSGTKKSRVPEKIESTDEVENNELDLIDPDAKQRGDMPMTVVGHLDEFRSRILIVLGVIIVLTLVNFYFSEHIVNYINKPFLSTGNKLNIFKLSGGFIIRLKASAAIAILITIPLIFFHIWRYIAPAIETTARTFSRLTIIFAVFLFYAGISFIFFILLPLMIEVLLSFIPSEMLSTIGADDYLSFIFLLSLAMGIIFELPIIILVLTKLGIITPAILISKRKVAIVSIWVLSAIISPPDPLSQSLVAIPLMFLYELSILISRFIIISRKKRDLKAGI